MPALGPRAGHWATYEAPWRPPAAAELASAIRRRGLSWAQALRPGGRATGQALSLAGTCRRLSRSAALMTQGYTGPCASWSDGTY